MHVPAHAAPDARPAPDPTPDPAPVLRAAGLVLRTRRGPVFGAVDVDLAPGGLLSVHGPAGSGRTMLLLALCGRAAVSGGTLTVAGTSRPREIRRVTAFAGAEGVAGPEPELTVGRQEREPAGPTPLSLDDTAAVLGLTLHRDRPVGELPVLSRILLAAALAARRAPAVLLLDDADAGLTPEQRLRLAVALRALADSGPAVVASGTDPLPGADAHLPLGTALTEHPAADPSGPDRPVDTALDPVAAGPTAAPPTDPTAGPAPVTPTHGRHEKDGPLP
ncbi:ABC transporter ATP-binding protein [Pseudonocardia kujensis]|uniref:ATP-binding cassette domain-containing protein n=1 Tax=Pseudonocardia kujensis TaxID=1128675 RepID=UPI001E3E6F38|nr:ABC transporter ATP-binding protein [Pseudonocardia kujensis]MCE0766811.1 ABC transporter ATP-binding protein [Pseudonocardia kujensis]